MTSAQVVETSVTENSSFQNYTHPDDHTTRITLSCYIGENCSKIGCAITANSQGTLTWFSARATATVLTSKTFFCSFVLFFSFFRFSGVVRNDQAKLIRDFLPLGVVQKQMKCPMNGFVLHVNNNLENQFSTKKKLPRLWPSHISPAEHTVN